MRLQFTILLLVFSLQSLAQLPTLQHYGVDEGLAGSCVYRTLQDSKGFMWFLTNKGLSRFDGSRFQNFTMADGLPQNDIFLAGEDRHQRLWIYSFSHNFCYYDLKSNQFHTIPNTINIPKTGYITHFIDTDTGMIVYAGAGIIYKIDAKQRVTLLRSKWENPNRSIDMPIQRDYPMITGEPIIYRTNTLTDTVAILSQGNDVPQTIVVNKYSFTAMNNAKTALADSVLFIANDDWLTSYDKNNITKKTFGQLSKNYDNKGAKLCVVGGNTRLAFVYLTNDCFIVDAKLNRLPAYDFAKTLNTNGINADKDGNFWICTKENGVFVLEKEMPKTTPIATILTTASIKSIAKDTRGNLIIGNSEGGIYVSTQGILRKIMFDKPVKFSVKTLKALSDGRIFVAWKDFGFTILSAKQLYDNRTISTKKIDLKAFPLKVFAKEKLPIIAYSPFKNVGISAKDDVLLVGYNSTDMLRDSADYWVTNALERGAINQTVAKDLNNNIWIGKSSGLWCLKIAQGEKKDPSVLDTLNTLKKQFSVLNQAVFHLVHDSASRLWIATGVGLNLLKTDKPTDKMTLQSIKELANDVVERIFIDKNNALWLLTNRGISTLKIHSETPLKYGFQRLNMQPFVPSQELTDLVADSVHLYVSTHKGLVIIDLQKLLTPTKNDKKLPLAITSIKINKRDTVLQSSYQLSYFQNTIDISFVAINYQSIKNIGYEYQMLTPLSKDTVWHAVADFHKEFAYLEPETYHFYIRATNQTDNTSAVEHLVFEIDLPFWRKTWFLLFMSILLIIIVLTYFHRRIEKIKAEAATKTELNQRFADLELKALQAQMNPHFIFNALTAVQSFILNKDTHAANDYLTKFSKLMRQSLEASRRKFVPIEDEIELLTNYIALEQVRFSHKFDFECIVGPNVDVGNEIPSMLLQPFIENAINHGILYQEARGHLTLMFQKDGNALECTIEDDGVGRKEAAKKQAKSLHPHISRATDIMQERVAMFRQANALHINILVIDKMKNGKGIGTKVIITIV